MADLISMLAASSSVGGGPTPPPVNNIVFVGSTQISLTGRTSNTTWSLLSLINGIDTQPSADDIVIIQLVSGGATSAVLSIITSGYTTLANLTASSTRSVNSLCSYKFMGATPDTSITFSGSGSTAWALCGVINVYRNVSQTDTFPIVNTATFSNTVKPTPPAITPSSGAFSILCGGGGGHDQGNAPYTNVEPFTNFTSTSANDSVDGIVGLGDIPWTSGTFTPVRWAAGIGDSTDFSSTAFTAAMRSD